MTGKPNETQSCVSMPVTPTPAQQTQSCQQQYDTATSSLNMNELQAEILLNNNIAAQEQTINQLANNGMTFSGAMGQAQQNLANTKARLASMIAQYQTSLGVLKNSLQTCLSSIVQNP